MTDFRFDNFTDDFITATREKYAGDILQRDPENIITIIAQGQPEDPLGRPLVAIYPPAYKEADDGEYNIIVSREAAAWGHDWLANITEEILEGFLQVAKESTTTEAFEGYLTAIKATHRKEYDF